MSEEEGEWLSQVDALADTQQLIRLLTESHPDPYRGPGGPIGFHRRCEQILSSIDEQGLTRDGLLRRLRPLIASLGDGHTVLFPPESEPGAPEKVGRPILPIDFDPVEERLVVSAVYREEDRELLGTRLLAVEGVPFEELVSRIESERGADNAYSNLVHLADGLVDSLFSARASLALRMARPGGETCSTEIALMPSPLGDPITPATTVDVPALTASDLGWGFLGEDRSVACLRIASLERYREAFEINRQIGHTRFLDTHLAEASRGAPAQDLDAAIAAVPSAAEQLLALFTAMRDAETGTLLVDLRDNGGGNSFFAVILAYFLYGMDRLIEMDWGYQVPRYSPLYLANYLSPPEEKRLAIEASMGNVGYDFSEERAWQRQQREGFSAVNRKQALADARAQIAGAPSFARMVERAEGNGMWSPRVVVLTSARTYSAAFDVAAMLVKRGVRLVGVPSSQAGNCCIDGLFYTLDNSQITGIVSYKWSCLFPDDPKRDTLLQPDVELTYDYLAATGFDPNAAVRLALDELQ